jgi:hypothetical protein
MTMLNELDEDHVEDVEAINDLKHAVADVFAGWRVRHGIGLGGPGT